MMILVGSFDIENVLVSEFKWEACVSFVYVIPYQNACNRIGKELMFKMLPALSELAAIVQFSANDAGAHLYHWPEILKKSFWLGNPTAYDNHS